MTNTMVTFYPEPLNIDYLIGDLRFNYGDFTGAIYSDTMIRTALVNGIRFLQKRWASKYQIYSDDAFVAFNSDSSIVANTADGQATIPSGLVAGDVFRNPYITFTQPSPPTIETNDEMAIILAATYLLRKADVASSSTELVSWATEDIRFTNLSQGGLRSKLLAADKDALDDYFRKNIAKPRRSDFPVTYLPGYNEIR